MAGDTKILDPKSDDRLLRKALTAHDTAWLFEWLMTVFSYQGISDAAARSYISAHGNTSWKGIMTALASRPACSKLQDLSSFQGVGYIKLKMPAILSITSLIVRCPICRCAMGSSIRRLFPVPVHSRHMRGTSIGTYKPPVVRVRLCHGLGVLGLAGCATPDGMSLAEAAKVYGPVPDEKFPIPAVDVSKVDPKYFRRTVRYDTKETSSTIIVDPSKHCVYRIEGGGSATRYGANVGRARFLWNGDTYVGRKTE